VHHYAHWQAVAHLPATASPGAAGTAISRPTRCTLPCPLRLPCALALRTLQAALQAVGKGLPSYGCLCVGMLLGMAVWVSVRVWLSIATFRCCTRAALLQTRLPAATCFRPPPPREWKTEGSGGGGVFSKLCFDCRHRSPQVEMACRRYTGGKGCTGWRDTSRTGWRTEHRRARVASCAWGARLTHGLVDGLELDGQADAALAK
jgi:hypothetical protein